MTTNPQERIKRLFELDGKRTSPTALFKLCEILVRKKQGEIPSTSDEAALDFYAMSPLVPPIIRELLLVIEKQHESLREIATGRNINGEKVDFPAYIALDAFELSAPYVGLVKKEVV